MARTSVVAMGRARTVLAPPGIKAKSPQRAGAQSHVLSPGAKAAGRGLDSDPTGIIRTLLTAWPGTSAPCCSARGGSCFGTHGLGLLSIPPRGPASWVPASSQDKGAAGPPPAGMCLVMVLHPPLTPRLSPPHRPLHWVFPTSALLLGPLLIKGSATCGHVACTGAVGPPHQGGPCLHPTARMAPVQAERGRERQTLKSIYWCWQRKIGRAHV